MIDFALDTNTLSYYMRGEGRVAERLATVPPQRVALPAVVVHEVLFGLRRMARPVQLSAFGSMLKTCTVLDFDTLAAEHAADMRVSLEASGTPIGPHDLLIAATARRYGRTLVTHNTREFSRVAGLSLQDWY